MAKGKKGEDPKRIPSEESYGNFKKNLARDANLRSLRTIREGLSQSLDKIEKTEKRIILDHAVMSGLVYRRDGMSIEDTLNKEFPGGRKVSKRYKSSYVVIVMEDKSGKRYNHYLNKAIDGIIVKGLPERIGEKLYCIITSEELLE